jgi:outer membrane protein TolC
MKGLQTLIIAVSMFAVGVLVAQASPEESNQPQTNVMPLTLNDVLRMTLENNLNVAVDRLPPDVAQFMIGTYFQPFQPTLRISANGTRGTTPSPSLLSGAPFLFQLTHSYDISMGQTLRTGTSYGVDISLNRLTSNNIFALYNPSWFGQARYGITQHLLQNRGTGVNGHSIRIAQNNHRISESQFEQQMMDLVAQAQNTYWDYVFSIEDVKVKQESVHLAEKTLDENSQKVANGVLAPLDLVQAESQLATMQDGLVVSTYSSRQDEDQLKKTITSQTDPGLIVAKLTPMDTLRRPATGDVVPVGQAIQIALENRPEIRQVRLLMDNAEIDTAYTKNQRLPVLDVNAAYTQTGLAGSPNLPSAVQGLIGTPITGLTAGKMSDALRQVFSGDYNTYSFGFSLQIPLSNKAASSDYDRALRTRRLAQTQIDATAQQIALEVRTALNQVEMNQVHVETAGKSRDLAQKTLDAEQKKYELGVSTLFFVLQDQTNLSIAQTNEVQALVNYTKSLVALDRATGQTLSHNRIEIEKATPRIATNARAEREAR